MKLGLIIAGAILGIIVFVGGILLSTYVSYANYGNQQENLIKATYENNQNIYAQYGQKISEMAQVPTMYKDDVIQVTTAAIQGRYGKDGSKAVFQFLKEQNPTLDVSLYARIQQVIESGRNDFQNAQTTLIDIRRSYSTILGNVWEGWWLKLAGYPKINLETQYKPITTIDARDTFSSGVEAGPKKIR